MVEFVKQYLDNLKALLEKIDIDSVVEIVSLFETTLETKGVIYVLGNGGSSATASHMVNDLGVGLSRRDIVNFNIVSLADNTPVITAIANDMGYDEIFKAQLKNNLSKNDVIVAISCSGNSDNILKAVKYAKEFGCSIVGITGFDGGALKELSTVNFHVDTAKGDYGLVEDMHMILDHIIYSYYINKGLKSE